MTRSIPFLLCLALPLASPAADSPYSLSVVHYDLRLQLDIAGESVSGELVATARGHGSGSDSLVLDVGDLTVESVSAGEERLAFTVADHRLSVQLPAALPEGRSAAVTVSYHGQPRRGLRFFKDRQQAYTAFSTSHWMPAVDAPEQKATLRLRLSVAEGQVAVASGRQVRRRTRPAGRVEYEWVQEAPLPSYVFGFATGPFRRASQTRRGVRLEYLGAGASFTDAELRRVFAETGSMLEFFEERAGVRYPGKSYTQVLAAGRVEQEVGLFTLLSESYGRRLLDDDPQDLWLMAHELAHQWWGNSVTCRDWNHFWLNEGLATFLADAYLERRFGPAVYAKQIAEVRADYERVRDKGGDKALVFPDWLKPSADDRVIVYRKGAYVLQLLRESLGDTLFWAGLRAYTRGHMGGSVTTADFQESMEKTTGRDLDTFFERWVYSAGAPRARSHTE